jgi:hypothetical protein
LEGHTLKEVTSLKKIVDDADSLIVISQKDETVALTYSQNLNELEVLDMLTLITSTMYHLASEVGDDTVH